jgi:hypothetical protein
VTVLRSPSIVVEASVCSGVTRILAAVVSGRTVEAARGELSATTAADSDAAHSPQNLKAGGFSNPHLAQRLFSGVAQLPQNFKPAGFSNSHFEQRIRRLPNSRRPMREYRRNTDQRKQTRDADRATKGGVLRSCTRASRPVVPSFAHIAWCWVAKSGDGSTPPTGRVDLCGHKSLAFTPCSGQQCPASAQKL